MKCVKSSHIHIKNSSPALASEDAEYAPYNDRNIYADRIDRLSWLGKEKDLESGLGDHGVRKYDAGSGRFLSVDPLWESQLSWNPYHYCYNNPINLLDVDGRMPGDPFKSAAQAAHDFGKNYNPLSFAINLEVSTTIYQYSENGTNWFTYAVPNAFDPRGANPTISKIDKPGYERVAEAHTHGPYSQKGDRYEKIDPDFFSGKDKENNIVNQFLITPGGHLKLFDFLTGRITTLTNDMPKDFKNRNSYWKMVDDNPDKRPLPLIYDNNGGMNPVNDAKIDYPRGGK